MQRVQKKGAMGMAQKHFDFGPWLTPTFKSFIRIGSIMSYGIFPQVFRFISRERKSELEKFG